LGAGAEIAQPEAKPRKIVRRVKEASGHGRSDNDEGGVFDDLAP
jgi:hypothetical protein